MKEGDMIDVGMVNGHSLPPSQCQTSLVNQGTVDQVWTTHLDFLCCVIVVLREAMQLTILGFSTVQAFFILYRIQPGHMLPVPL
jgi:hypothetical protein